jgi:hypothetical protein
VPRLRGRHRGGYGRRCVRKGASRSRARVQPILR